MPLLNPLDVTVIYDDMIWPHGPKMVACIEPHLGFFFRINSEPKWQTPVKLNKDPHHNFLVRDSYLECGEPLELDDYIIEEALRRHGVVGAIHAECCREIFAAVEKARYISPDDKKKIQVALGC